MCDKNENVKLDIRSIVVGAGLMSMIAIILFPIVLPAIFDTAYIFDGGDFIAVRIIKSGLGLDSIRVMSKEDISLEAKSMGAFLDDKFGDGWSLEKAKMRAEIEELVGWHEKLDDSNPPKAIGWDGNK